MISSLLQIVIGLAFIYLVLAIIVSGINEWIAQWLGWRGEFLRQGMVHLISDDEIYRRVLHHPLIGNLYRDRAGRGKPPSYVDSAQFASALVDVVCTRAATLAKNPALNPKTGPKLEDLYAAVDVLRAHDHAIADVLQPILNRAKSDISGALDEIEQWYSRGMDRVSGWYKARTGKSLFALAFAVAALGNVNSIALVDALGQSPELRAALESDAETAVRTGKVAGVAPRDLPSTPATTQQTSRSIELLQQYEGLRLPIGLSCAKLDGPAAYQSISACSKQAWAQLKGGHAPITILGWLITALAVSLGAPFWFDLLARLVNVRGSGAKPNKPASTAA